MRDTSFLVAPMPDHAFFEQPVLQHLLGQSLLQITRLGTKRFHLIGGGLACRIAGQALLACFQELLRPTVIQALRDTLAAAQRGNTLLATQTFKYDTYFLFRRIKPARLIPSGVDGDSLIFVFSAVDL